MRMVSSLPFIISYGPLVLIAPSSDDDGAGEVDRSVRIKSISISNCSQFSCAIAIASGSMSKPTLYLEIEKKKGKDKQTFALD